MGALIDLTGQTFGIWRVVEQAPRRDNKTRWLCECTVCGGRLSLRSTVLRSSAYVKCYGSHGERKLSGPSPLKKPLGHAAATEVYGHYRRAARDRGLVFTLTRAAFDELTRQDCHYCAAPPGNTFKRRHYNGAFVYSGIDRKDSSRGYEDDNCLPCCAACNVMKQDLGYDAFIAHVHRIASIHPTRDVAIERMALGRGGNRRPANFDTGYGQEPS